MTTTASCPVEDVEQVALIAAQDGTAAGCGAEDGLGEASADGLGDGMGVEVGLAFGEGEGLERAAWFPGPQPASASSAERATTPSLTGN
jgi:hypothetical protein